jgi:hypothetical protein
MTEGDPTMGLFREWVATLIATLEMRVDEDTRAELIEPCGRACALQFDDIERAKTIRHGTKGIDGLLDRLNQQVPWCGKWVRNGDTITSVCEECGCPLVRAGLVRLSPTFCNCSRGWAKAVFEALLGMPPEVELQQAIGRGDPVCQFVVRLKPAASASICPHFAHYEAD